MPAPLAADLIISGGTILCMDPARRVLRDHLIAVRDSLIAAIEPAAGSAFQAARTIDASGCIVLPGLINSHTHLPMSYFRGLADDLPLDRWLNHYIWPLEAKLLDRDFIFHASLHGAAEMIKNGITQIHDMYFSPAAIAEACTQAGLRAIIGEAVLEFKLDRDSAAPAPGTKAVELRQRFAGNPLVDFNLAPHSIYACSRQTLASCAQAAADHGLLLHLHLSESRREAEDCLREHGLKPVHYLKELGFLELPAVYAHGIWVDEDEIALLAGTPSSIAVCTESNLKLASGILPLHSYRRHGINTCLATDGVASNNNLDLLAEMDVTAKLHKAVSGDPSFLPAEEMVAMATCDAARALGIAGRRGSLAPGLDADLCVLDCRGIESLPLYNPYSHVVYTLGARQVRDVVIAGEPVLEEGSLTRLDEAELVRAAQHHQARISAELHP